MGRPLFSTCSSLIGSHAMHREENVGVANKPAEQGPRTWCETDVDPDSDAWWNTKQIFIESFTTTVEASERGTLRSQGRIEAPMASLEPDLKIEHKDEMHVDTDLFPLFPKQYTISEDELARVALDTLQVDGEDDFELAWDEESDSGDMDVDMDIEPAAVYSDASTPAPSTPVAAARIVSLPVSVPSTPARRGTLPTSTTPVRQNSFHATPSMGSIPIASPSSMTTRSVARVRGFAVHSPRTELVL